MNNVAATERFVQMTAPDTLRIERLLPDPQERVWAYLTESEQRRKWLAAGTTDTPDDRRRLAHAPRCA